MLVDKIIGLDHVGLLFTKITMLRGKDGSEIGSGLEQSILSVAETVVH